MRGSHDYAHSKDIKKESEKRTKDGWGSVTVGDPYVLLPQSTTDQIFQTR